MSLQGSKPKTNHSAKASAGWQVVCVSFAANPDATYAIAILACRDHAEPGMRLVGVRTNDKL